jgi:hypothetical protein
MNMSSKATDLFCDKCATEVVQWETTTDCHCTIIKNGDPIPPYWTTNNWNKPKTDIEKAADLLEQDELYNLWGKRVRTELAALTADRDRLAGELAQAREALKTVQREIITDSRYMENSLLYYLYRTAAAALNGEPK